MAFRASGAGRDRVELQLDVVGVPEGQHRTVRDFLDLGVLDAHLVEMLRPLVDFRFVLTAESHVIEADPELAEAISLWRGSVALEADEESVGSKQTDHKSTGLVSHRNLN